MPSIERILTGDVLAFDLGRESDAARDADILARTGRTGRTLVKDGPLRVTVELLAPGGEIPRHRAEAPLTVQPLRGSLTFRAGGREVSLRAGDLLALDREVEYSIASREGAVFLLSLSFRDRRAAARLPRPAAAA